MDWSRLHIFLAVALALAAAVFDLRTRELPNRLTLGALVLGPSLHFIHGLMLHGPAIGLKWLGLSLLGIVVCGFFPALSFARREMGGGDVKLFAALGGLCGPWIGFDAQAFTFLLTLSLVLPVRLIRHRRLGQALGNLRTSLRNFLSPKTARVEIDAVRLPPVALAPWIALGLSLALLRNGILS